MADALPGWDRRCGTRHCDHHGDARGSNTDSAAIEEHVAAALVGTFLGILLAYGVVSPLAQAVGQRAEEGGQALECIKACILAQQQGYNPQIAVEFGRKIMASELRLFLRT